MKYEEFIAKVRQRARLATSEDAERVARATLETLAERLQLDEVVDLASQLPPELAVYMQSDSAGATEKFDLDGFFLRVATREGVGIAEANFHARVVTGLIAETVTMGEIEDLRSQLPEEFAKLFEVENEGDIPELGTIADVE